VSFEVIEFYPGVIKSRQYTTVAVTGPGVGNPAATGNVTITTVNTSKTMLAYGGTRSSYPGSGSGMSDYETTAGATSLTSATNVATTSGNASSTQTTKVTVVEFF
jgi:hypothetical protein